MGDSDVEGQGTRVAVQPPAVNVVIDDSVDEQQPMVIPVYNEQQDHGAFQLDDTSATNHALVTNEENLTLNNSPHASNAEGVYPNSAPLLPTPANIEQVVQHSVSLQVGTGEGAEINRMPQSNDDQAEPEPNRVTSANVEGGPNDGLKRKHKADSDEEDDGMSCPICLESWTNSGGHRLVALRCGHLFGRSCITRWLQPGSGVGRRCCPQCNKKAEMRDIRTIFARKLQPLDTCESDRLKEELQRMAFQKNRLELELAHANVTAQLHKKQIEELKQNLQDVVAQNNRLKVLQGSSVSVQSQSSIMHQPHQSTSVTGSDQFSIHFTLQHRLVICREGGCRVMAYSSHLCLLVISQKSANNLFTGYGIKKINTLTFQPFQFIFLHPKPIRDLAFHPQQQDLLLSVSQDRCAKLFNVMSNTVVHSYTADSPLWSCCWDADDPHMFYVGCQNGNVLQYDTRRTNEPIARYCVSHDMAPAVSLAAIPACPGRAMSRGGFLLCTLKSCWGYERTAESHVCQPLPLDGPFTALCYDHSTQHVLVSSRPSEKFNHARHLLCQFGKNLTESEPVCSPVHTFLSGYTQKFLSRPCLLPLCNDTLVAAYHESANAVALWSVSTGNHVFNIPISDPIIDLCPISVNGVQYLATLSEKSLRVYCVKYR